MASGTIYGSYSSYASSNYQYFRVWANWTTTTNTLDNTTTVSLELYGKKYADNGYSVLTTTGTWKGSIYVNGVKVKTVSYYKAMGSSSVWLASASATVPHNDDGSKDCAISFSITGPTDTALEGCTSSESTTLTLETIPRASDISATNSNVGASSDITVSQKSTDYIHSISYSFGDLSGYLSESGAFVDTESKYSTTSLSMSIPTSFYAQIPNAKSGICTLTCTTYSSDGETQIGSAKTCEFTVSTVESECKPTVGGAVVDTNSATKTLTGNNSILVKGYSTALCTISATAKNSASISSKSINGTTVTSNSQVLANVSRTEFIFSATDSRGYISSLTLKPTIIEYTSLLNTSTAVRTSSTGSDVLLTVKGKCFNGSFGAVNNTLTVSYRTRVSGGTWSSAVTPTVAISTYNGDGSVITIGDMAYTNSYEIELTISDKLNTITKVYSISKGEPVYYWGEDSFNFNTPVDFKNNTSAQTLTNLAKSGGTLGGDITVTGRFIPGPNTAPPIDEGGQLLGTMENGEICYYDPLDLFHPIGSIYISTESTSPASLFGGTWERMKDRFLLGAGDTYTAGATGGEATHTLTVDEMPSHNHSVSTGTSYVRYYGSQTNYYGFFNNKYNDGGTKSLTCESAGGDAAHNNMPPYIVVYMWKRLS